MNKFTITIALFGAVLGVSVLRSLRRSHIRVEYSTAWISAAVAIVGIAVWPHLLQTIADKLGIGEEAGFLLFAVIVLSFLMFRISLEMSRLRDHNTVLIQRVAVLEYQLKGVMQEGAESIGDNN